MLRTQLKQGSITRREERYDVTHHPRYHRCGRFAAVAIYNKLVRLRNTVKSSWADIDVQCKKRYDLVPNLVEAVKDMRPTRNLFSKR